MAIKHILFLDNKAFDLFNFRGAIIRHLLGAGYKISICTPLDIEYFEKFQLIGVSTYQARINLRGMNPLQDIRLMLSYLSLMNKLRPDLVISYTIKPNIYGGMAASVLRIPYLAIVPGTGTVFLKRTLITRIVEILYTIGLGNAQKVWVLNDEDALLFHERDIVAKEKIDKLDGEGCDLTHFCNMYPPEKKHSFTFLLIGRLLWTKGIGYYAEAARMLKQRHPNVQWQLLGMLSEGKDGVPLSKITQWEEEKIIQYLGSTTNVVPYIEQADCIVLPSYYREGVPRSLMEGAAMGLPLITTDNIGCREVVIDGYNGFLCQKEDVGSLVESMEKMLSLSEKMRQEMGINSRRLMEERFDVKHTIFKYDKFLSELNIRLRQ